MLFLPNLLVGRGMTLLGAGRRVDRRKLRSRALGDFIRLGRATIGAKPDPSLAASVSTEWESWRESVGIEPTSRLAAASAVLKTVRDTSPVLSHAASRRFFCRQLRSFALAVALFP